MANEVVMRVGFEDAPGGSAPLDDAVSKAKAAQEEARRASEQAAQEEAEHLKLIEAQYGQLGPAAAKAWAQAKASADAAGEAVARAGKMAETGGKGYEKAAALAAAGINKLDREIEELRAAGGDVTVLENRLEGLRAEAQKNSRAFGEFRKNLKDVQDETKIAQRAAGEYEGTLSSLEDVVNSVNPALGNQVVQLLAVQSALFIVQQIGRDMAAGMKDIAVAIGVSDEAAEKFAKNLEAKFSANPFKLFGSYLTEAKDKQAAFFEDLSNRLAEQVDQTEKSSGALGRYALNLRNVLSAQGYDVAKASLAELLVMEDEFRERVAARGPAIEKLAAQIRGDHKALQDDTAVTLGALAKLGDAELANAEKSKKAAEVVRELVARYKEAGAEIPEMLEEWSRRLQLLVQDHENLATILNRVLSAVGIKGPEAIDKQIDALREYAGEVERSGDMTADQAGLILAQIDQIRRALELLPESQRAAADGMLAALEELEERYRGMGKVALSAFGVQTPEAIDRSITAVEGLMDAFGPLGQVTAEQAAIVVGALQKVLDAISVLPKEQRAAMADQEVAIRALADQYGEIAVRRKQYAEDILAAEEKQLAREKEIIAERQEMLSTFASAFEQLQAKLDGKQGDGGAEQVAKLKEELAGLEKQDFLSPEQLGRMNELKDQIASAAQATSEFGQGQKEAALSVQEVDGAVVGLIDSLKQNKQAWNELPLASQEAIANMIGRLQQTAAEGGVTAGFLRDQFLTVGQIIEQAGGALGDLGTAIDRSAEDTLNLRREFASLQEGIEGTADATGKLGAAQKDAAALAKERSEIAVKAAKDESEALAVVQEGHDGVVASLQEEVRLSERLLVVWKELKECMASTGFA